MINDERQDSREMFLTVWQKYKARQPVEPLEQHILQVILQHPEYHALFEKPATLLTQEFHAETGQSNPFLHMGLHLAIREQVTIDQPAGIADIYQQLLQRQQGDQLATEHSMMEPLAQSIWQTMNEPQRSAPEHYLASLRRLL
jgi:Domain of unknown function (DUF1841)